MGYLKCKSCEGCYELQTGELPEEFDRCSCGGELEFYDDKGKKRGYTTYSRERSRKKMHPLLKILIIIVGGFVIFNFIGAFPLLFILYGLEYFGQSAGTYIFAIFFGICIAVIIGLLWLLFRRK